MIAGRLAIAAMIAIAPGCGEEPALLAITLRADDALDDATLARVTRLQAFVRGDESGELAVELEGRGLAREERVRVVPQPSTRRIGIAFVARDERGAPLASGDTTDLTLAATGTTPATVTLAPDAAPPVEVNPDAGSGDAGSAGDAGESVDGTAATDDAGSYALSALVSIAVAEKPSAIAIAQLLPDARPELAVVRGGMPGITLVVAGASGWVVERVLPLTQTAPRGIAVGRLDGDALDDLVVATNEGFSLVRSTSSPLAAQRIDAVDATGTIGLQLAGNGIAVGDLDGDALPDVAVAASKIDQIVWWKSSATGFVQRPGRSAMTDPFGLAIADFDGAGGNDIGVALMSTDRLRILFDVGTGAIPAVDAAVGTHPRGVAAGDLDGDGRADLVVTLPGSKQLVIAWGQPTASVGTPSTIAGGDEPIEVAIGDLDGDGLPDLVVADKHGKALSILRHSGARAFTLDTISLGMEPAGVAVGDLDLDGDLDIVVAVPVDNAVGILTNQRR